MISQTAGSQDDGGMVSCPMANEDPGHIPVPDTILERSKKIGSEGSQELELPAIRLPPTSSPSTKCFQTGLMMVERVKNLEEEEDLEIPLLCAELQSEWEKLQRERRRADEVQRQKASLDSSYQAEKEKERARVDRQRALLEEAQCRLEETRGKVQALPECGKEQLREQLREEVEAVEGALRAFEDVEFQALERVSALDEERESRARVLGHEELLARRKISHREERLRCLRRMVGRAREQLSEAGQHLAAEGNADLALRQEPLLYRSLTGSFRRKRRESTGILGLERPVSMLEEDLASPPVHLRSLISQNFASTQAAMSISQSKQLIAVPGPSGGQEAMSISQSKQLIAVPGPSGGQDPVIKTSPHRQTGVTRVSRASTFHEGSLTLVVEMERKLRAAVAERERLLQARELEKKQLENTQSESAKREERNMMAERVTSTPQPSQHWAGPHFDLRSHVESAGHGVASCPHLVLSSFTCRGSLTKVGQRFQTWRTRWFVFDTKQGRLSYYTDRGEAKRKGVIYFQAFEEVYFDHLRKAPKSPNPLLTFCLKTYDRLYYLVAPSDEALRIWMEVVLTAVEGPRRF